MAGLILEVWNKALRWGFYLALTGNLITSLVHEKNEAAHALQGGLISLTQINQQLFQNQRH